MIRGETQIPFWTHLHNQWQSSFYQSKSEIRRVCSFEERIFTRIFGLEKSALASGSTIKFHAYTRTPRYDFSIVEANADDWKRRKQRRD